LLEDCLARRVFLWLCTCNSVFCQSSLQ